MINSGFSKDSVIDLILKVEGGYVDDPRDSGGETNYGITKQVAAAYGYRGRMIDLPVALAREIYIEKYWNSVKGDRLNAISPLVAEEVVDTAVNMGVVRSSIFLQRVISALSSSNINADGVIGNVTIDALNDVVARRGDAVVVKALNCLQGALYIKLTEKRPKNKAFVYGWLSKRVGL